MPRANEDVALRITSQIVAAQRLSSTRALQRTAAPLGSWTVQLICSRPLQPTGRFRRRSLSLVVRQKTVDSPCVQWRARVVT